MLIAYRSQYSNGAYTYKLDLCIHFETHVGVFEPDGSTVNLLYGLISSMWSPTSKIPLNPCRMEAPHVHHLISTKCYSSLSIFFSAFLQYKGRM
ncbi:hypothetical protein Hanom_Chr13g01192951 [Helianthus anomalus]